MEYIQEKAFSDRDLFYDFSMILNAKNEKELLFVLENSKQREFLEKYLKEVLEREYSSFPNVQLNNDKRFIIFPFKEALEKLRCFFEDSKCFSDEKMKERKLIELLNGVSIVETEILLRLLRGNYNKEILRNHFFRQKEGEVVFNEEKKRKRAPIKQQEENKE